MIDKNSKIKLGFLILIISTFSGAGFQVTKAVIKIEEHEDKVKALERQNNNIEKTILETQIDVKYIKELLKGGRR